MLIFNRVAYLVTKSSALVFLIENFSQMNLLTFWLCPIFANTLNIAEVSAACERIVAYTFVRLIRDEKLCLSLWLK